MNESGSIGLLGLCFHSVFRWQQMIRAKFTPYFRAATQWRDANLTSFNLNALMH